MAKKSGIGQGLIVGGYDLSTDISTVSTRGGPAMLPATGINATGTERMGGKLDGGIDFTAYFDPAAGRAHPRLSALPTGPVVVCYFMASTIGAECASIVGRQFTYDGTLGQDGSLTFSVPHAASGYSLEWGDLLTAGLRTDTSATNGASVDGGAASTTGWSAYLQVTAVAGTNVVVTLEDSANDSAFAVFTSSAFTSVTAVAGVGSQRIAGVAGATVRRYVRAVTSGTFSSASFLVAFVRHPTGATA